MNIMENRQKEIHRMIIEQTEKRHEIERKRRKREALLQLANSFSSSMAMIISTSTSSQLAMSLNKNISSKEFLELSKASQERAVESIDKMGKHMLKAADNIVKN